MDMNLEQLEDFAVLAAEQHFGRAAARLHLSPSALSRRVQRLEQAMGVRLVERDGGGFTGLTPAGQRFLPRAELLLRHADGALRAAQAAPAVPHVCLGIPGAPSDHFPAPAWQALVVGLDRMLPGCRVEAVGVPYGLLTASVLTGRVDVLLTTGDVDRPGLDAVPLIAVERICLLPPGHALAGAPEVTMADVADLPMIVEPRATPQWMSPWVLGDVRGRREMRLVEVRARSLADVKATVLSGAAVTLATSTLLPFLEPPLSAPLVSDAPPIELSALRRAHDDRDEVLALLDVLKVLSTVLRPAGRPSPPESALSRRGRPR